MFGHDLDADGVAKAIAVYVRTIVSGNSPYDRFKAGDKSALSDSQQNGMKIFFSNKARCDSCHEGINFTAGKFANVGIGMDKPTPDLGRFNVTKREEDKGAFKTPTLRDVALTGPYMHNGSFSLCSAPCPAPTATTTRMPASSATRVFMWSLLLYCRPAAR